MAHFPKPYFLKCRETWKVQIGGKQHNLGSDKDEAFRRYHELMAHPPEAPPVTLSDSMFGIIDRFLGWCKGQRAEQTYEWYRWRLQSFADATDKAFTVAQLRPYHVDEWLAKHPDWSSGMKHGACRAVQRAMRWAEKKEYIDRSPTTHYEKPRPGKRSLVIPPDEFHRLLSSVPGAPFRDLLIVTWETGCRPQESLAVEARHVDLKNARWVLPPDESKGEEFPRVVYLSGRALEITRRLMLKYPEGPMFRNTDEAPWTPFAVNCSFCRLQVRLGIRRMLELGVSRSQNPTRRNRMKEDDRASRPWCRPAPAGGPGRVDREAAGAVFRMLGVLDAPGDVLPDHVAVHVADDGQSLWHGSSFQG